MINKIKIMHVLLSNSFSGAENVACQIIKILNNENYENYYVCPNGPIKDVLKKKGIIFFPIQKFNYHELKKSIKTINPDIIHAHDYTATLLSAIIFKGSIISHIHSNMKDMQRCSKKTLCLLPFLNKIDCYIWVSNLAYEQFYYQKLIQNRSLILHNIIEINKDKYREDKIYDILFLGRLVEVKNPIRFIEITKKISEKKETFKAAIVGDGILKSSVEEKIKQYNLNNNIDVLGFLENPYEIIKKSKILLLTSNYEGMPMSVLEAMSMGTIVVSTKVGEVPYVVKEDCGFIGDSNEKIENFIEKVLDDEEYRKKLSNNSVIRFNQLNDTVKYKEAIIDCYQNLLLKEKNR